MGKLSFALGTIAGMAINMANARQRRVHELNEQGIKLCNNFHYESALECFLEASRLMPDNEIIKNNIKVCKSELKMHKEYVQQQSYQYINKPKNKKSVTLENKFPSNTKRDKSNSDWCNSCCTYIPLDNEYCPYCGSMDITKYDRIDLDNVDMEFNFDKTKYNFCLSCQRPILKVYGACPHCKGKQIKKF